MINDDGSVIPNPLGLFKISEIAVMIRDKEIGITTPEEFDSRMMSCSQCSWTGTVRDYSSIHHPATGH